MENDAAVANEGNIRGIQRQVRVNEARVWPKLSAAFLLEPEDVAATSYLFCASVPVIVPHFPDRSPTGK